MSPSNTDNRGSASGSGTNGNPPTTSTSDAQNRGSVAGSANSIFYGSESKQTSRVTVRPNEPYQAGAYGAAAINSNTDAPFAPFVAPDGRVVARANPQDVLRHIQKLFP